jgi:FkbM family methyltransferase
MWDVNGKLISAMRIARERGVSGLVQAVGRNLGVASMQAGLDESDIAWDFFHHQAAPGTMVDVGAHYGSALRPFARKGWQVFAFEPDAKNRAHLLGEFAGFPNLKIDPRAVADQARQGVTFYRSDVSSGISGLSAFDPSHRAEDRIDVTTLTDFAAANGVQGIDFLKIDTEGHDLFVLRGVPWHQMRPRLVLCEFENRKTEPLGYRYEDLANFLADQGYHVITSEWHPIERYGATHRWHRFAEGKPPPLSNPLGWGNILAVRDAADLPGLYPRSRAQPQVFALSLGPHFRGAP